MTWLLDFDTFKKMKIAAQAGYKPSAEQQGKFEARESRTRGLSIAGSIAEIEVKGVLTQTLDFFAFLFGGGNTLYGDIIEALAEADNTPAVEKIKLQIESPGGTFDGLFDTLAAIEQTRKPVEAVINNLGASAAFAIAAQADSITATNRAARIGSVGVAVTFDVPDDEVTITSTEAPKKRPDVTTDEGVAMVREELDALHEIFVESIAAGRGTTVEKVNADFGRGATLLSDEAKKRGMIDGIETTKLTSVESTVTTEARAGGDITEARKMDSATLKAQHPETYAAAVQEGVNQERDRVCGHLIMGEKSGAMETACTAIKDGSGMTATLTATYMTAGINRADVKARAGDNVEATPSESAGDDDTVVALVEKNLGVV